MPRHFVATAVDVDGEDSSRCAEECRHLELLECRLFGGASLLGTATDPGSKPVRCAECLRATEGSPGPARCWPAKGER